MFRDSMTGSLSLALFDAMLMILASLLALAKAGARIGRVPARCARQRHPFPLAAAASPAAPGRRRRSLRVVDWPPRWRPRIRPPPG